MSRAVLSIGSNTGDRLAMLRSVRSLAGDRLRAASRIYQTAPWGGIEQEPYLNAVLVLEHPDAGPHDWLAFAHDCERAAGRTREKRWGPRTLDVDVIAVYDEDGHAVTSDDPALTVPHPRAHERAFVLAPWIDVQPDAQLPQGLAADLLADLQREGDPSQAVEITDLELA